MKWKLTPTEPTPEMIAECQGERESHPVIKYLTPGERSGPLLPLAFYRASISAAPDPLEDAELVERGARAIYDAIDPTSGDSIAHTLHMSEYINDSVPVPQQLEQVMEICRSASRAFITAMKGE